MKNKILKKMSGPKFVIPVFAVIAIVVFVFMNKYVGEAPKVEFTNSDVSLKTNSEGNIDLSFVKGGRVADINVAVGQIVHKGDILAKLNAPDAEGVVAQTKGSLELAEAQYASLNSQYATTKKQQDLIVENAYQTLLSSGLEGVPSSQNVNSPIISGTYSCGKEGSYNINTYASSDSDTGYSFNFTGLEKGTASVKYKNSVSLGDCGLQIKWNNITNFDDSIDWTIDIPNKRSATYLANKNAYELALANREKTLSDLATNIGSGDNKKTSVANAQVVAARGAYEAALGSYQNNLIIAPADGVITSVDQNLKVGQSVLANKSVISIKLK